MNSIYQSNFGTMTIKVLYQAEKSMWNFIIIECPKLYFMLGQEIIFLFLVPY